MARFNHAMSDPEDELEAAYALQTPEDSLKLYGRWAKSYERSFAQGMDYRLPEHVAQAFVEFGASGPALDIGAGTGLVGAALAARGFASIDGMDISPQMLEEASKKGVYRKLFEGDMTGRLPVADGAYQAIVSSGTFTTGHVGPEALHEVLRIAAAGAKIVLSVSEAHWISAGFAAKFRSLGSAIGSFELRQVPIYGPNSQGAHANDLGQLVLFTKT